MSDILETQTMEFEIEGLSPLMMHNGRLADPLDEYAKQLKKVSSKRKKTDDDHEEMARIEFEGSLYLNDKGHPELPSDLLEATLRDGARSFKMGKQFQAGLFVEESATLDYDGPKSADGLLKKPVQFMDRRGVKVGQARVSRTRPIFPYWKAKFRAHFFDINAEDVERALEIAGRTKGVGDFRPKYGRFIVTSAKVLS